jgi:hypothetical protein
VGSGLGCYDYSLEKPETKDVASPISKRVVGDWTMLSDGSAMAAVQRFFHDKYDVTLPTPGGTQVGACEPGLPCHLWIDDIPSADEWEQIPLTNERAPVTYDLIVFAPTDGAKSHVAIVDHVESSTIFVMDSDARDDLRRAPLPHGWRGKAYGWFHLKKLDVNPPEERGPGSQDNPPGDTDPDPGPGPTKPPEKKDAGTGNSGPECTPNKVYCGGNQLVGAANELYRCNATGAPTIVARCANGCIVGTGGASDACAAPTACVANGDYCGGDKVNGEPDVLYDCGADGTATMIMRCPNGCFVAPAGQNDKCNP